MSTSVSRLDRAGAHRRAQRVRDGVMAVNELMETLVEIQERQDWLALGYKTWTEYYEGEFGPTRLKLTPEQRGQVVAILAASGMSKRKVAAALGIDEKTVRNDLRGAEKSALPSAKPQAKTVVPDPIAAFDEKYSGDVDSPPVDVPGQTAADEGLSSSADGPSRETASASVVEGPAAGAGLEGSGAGGKPQDPPADSEDKSLRDKVALVAGQPGPPSATTGEAAEPSSTRIEAAVGAQPEIPFSDELEEVEVPPASSSDPDGYDDPAADWMSAWRWLVYAAAEVGKDITDDERAEVRDDLTTIRRLILGES